MATTLVRIQLLSKTSTELAAINPVLSDGQAAIANSGAAVPVFKVGDGVRPWSALPDIVAAGAGADYVAGPVNTLPYGSPATVVIDNSVSPPTISFGIPGGQPGEPGVDGATGPAGPIGPTGPTGPAGDFAALAADSNVTGDWVFDPTQFFGFTAAEVASIKAAGLPIGYAADDSIWINRRLRLARAGNAVTFRAHYMRGTFAAPAATLATDLMFVLDAQGYDGTQSALGTRIAHYAIENWTSSAHGASLYLQATAAGSTTIADVMRVGAANLDVIPPLYSGWTLAEVDTIRANTGIMNSFLVQTINTKGGLLALGIGGTAINLARADGTLSALTNTPANGILGGVYFNGSSTAGLKIGAGIMVRASEAWTPTSTPSRVHLMAIRPGTTGSLVDMLVYTTEAMTFGNATDNPTFSFLGTGALTHNGSVIPTVNSVPIWTAPHTFSGNGGIGPAVTIENTTPELDFIDTDSPVNQRRWLLSGNVSKFTAYAANDAYNSFSQWLDVSRSGASITDISFGNVTSNPTYNFLGTGRSTFGGVVALPVSSAASPSVTCTTDLDTGVHFPGGDVLHLCAGGGSRLQIHPTLVASDQSGDTSFGIRVTNDNTGTSATSYLLAGNSTRSVFLRLTGTGFSGPLLTGGPAGEAAHLYTNGAVPICIATNSTERMRVTDTAVTSSVVINAPSFNVTSARAAKLETGRPTRAADILARLRCILYRLIEGNDREQIGMIAEEVADVCPWLSDGKTIAYDRLAMLLLADWQEARGIAHG